MAADRKEDPTVSFPKVPEDGQESVQGQDNLPSSALEDQDLNSELGMAESSDPKDQYGVFEEDEFLETEAYNPWDDSEVEKINDEHVTEVGYADGDVAEAEAESELEENVDAEAAAAAGKGKRNSRFAEWRGQRPFGAGLLMIMGGAVIMSPAYLTFQLSGIIISLSTISGVSTLLIGVMLIVCGLMTWFKGEGRILTGVVALILSIVALPTSNFGGFILGSSLAMVGGAWALSWSPMPIPAKEMGGLTRKERKELKRAEKLSRKSAATGATAIVAIAALAGAHTLVAPPEAKAQWLDGLPEIPGITVPDEAGGQLLPETPGLPEIELPDIGGIEESIDDLLEQGDEAAFELGRTISPQELGAMPVSDQNFTIKADAVRLIDNVSLSVSNVITTSGQSKPALRIAADKVELDNLTLDAPNSAFPAMNMTAKPGVVTTLEGNFSILVEVATMTPVIAGLETISLTIDANWVQEDIESALASIAINLPALISDQLVIKDAVLDSYMVESDSLNTSATLVAQ